MKLRTDFASEHYTPNLWSSDLVHDALAAHALMQAIRNRVQRAQDECQPNDVRRLEGIIRYADEILAGWTGAGE